jgi:hypothetical protein
MSSCKFLIIKLLLCGKAGGEPENVEYKRIEREKVCDKKMYYREERVKTRECVRVEWLRP